MANHHQTNARKHVLVIGGTGFCGLHLTQKLLKEGHKVRVLSRRGSADLSAWARHMLQGADIQSGDVLEGTLLASLMKGVDTVFHVASALKSRNSDDAIFMDIDLNLKASIQIVKTAAESGVRRIVYFSSAGAVYGHSTAHSFDERSVCNPISSYGIIKLASENYISLIAERSGMQHLIIRLTNPFGPGQTGYDGQGVMAVFLQKALKGESISIFSDGSAKRDYIYISDAIDAVELLDSQEACGIYNVGSGDSYTISEIADAVEATTQKTLQRLSIPAKHIADVGLVKIDTDQLRSADFKPKFTLQTGLKEHLKWLSQTNQIIS